MISDRLGSMLIEQVGSELTAHQTYMGISIHFERLSLKRWAALFRAQSIEEAGHGEKIMAFLIDNEVSFDLPALHGATTHYTDATEALEAALASELLVSGQFDAMAAAAQVEEERTIRALLDLVNSGINLFQAEPLLESVGGD